MNCPNKKKIVYHKTIDYANRGMDLEGIINDTNKYLLENDIALIYKKPTPIGIVDVSYQNNKQVITKAYFASPSTLDYNGIYRGKYVEFDAKETQSNTSFPLSNIHKHQLEHIEKVIYFGGIVFLIVRFTNLNLTFLLMGEDIISFKDIYQRKSIPLDYFKEHGFIIDLKYNPRLDYIKIVDSIINNKEVRL